MKYDFVLTCRACPEQYDVYDVNLKVAYVRMRWGWLRAYPYKPEIVQVKNDWGETESDQEIDWDTIIYEQEFDDDLLGVLPDNERSVILAKIDDAIANYYNDKQP